MLAVHIFLVTTMLVKAVDLCPSECKCLSSFNEVICLSVNLTVFPQGIPNATEYLYIQNSRLQKISKDDVLGLDRMISLHLNGNKLKAPLQKGT